MKPADALSLGRTPLAMQSRLAAMLFLQYFVQGAYLPVVNLYLQNHLKFTEFQIGLFGAGVAFGALISPFVSGQIADRFLSTERFLAVSHFLGGVVMVLIWFHQDPENSATTPILIALAFVYSILYVPTISLTNTLSFRNLAQPEREFPPLRMFGTIGFMAALWIFELAWLGPLSNQPERLQAARAESFLLSGVAGIGLAIYCLTLPHTPPDRTARVRFAPANAIGLLRNRAFLVIFLVSLPIAVVHKFHFVWNAIYLEAAGVSEHWIGRITTGGQLIEIGVIFSLGWLLKKLGFKWTITLGIVAYVLRNLVFAFFPSIPVLIAAQGLHGFCFACFFAAAFLLVDRLAPRDARASVQTFFSIFALGVGTVMGGLFAGWVAELCLSLTDKESYGPGVAGGMLDFVTTDINFFTLWLVPFAIALVTLAVFIIAFPRDPLKDAPPLGADEGK